MNMRIFSSNTLANTNSTQNSNNRPFLNMNLIVRQPQPQQIHHQQVVSITSEPPKKVKWGEPTWFLFHTLSVKIKESEFPKIRIELLNNIYSICTNLPCPDCANHAKTYLDGINFNTVQTKEDFKKLLHTFHNEVNKKKGYDYFPYEQLTEKYSLAITSNIIQNFMTHFSDRNRSIKLLATDLFRARLCISLKEWFNQNIHLFAA